MVQRSPSLLPERPTGRGSAETDIFMLDAFCDTAAMLQTRILEQLKRVIGNFTVLPNCFSIDFCKGADPFQLKHLSPQGVLRLQVSKLLPPAPGLDGWASEATEEPCSPPRGARRRDLRCR